MRTGAQILERIAAIEQAGEDWMGIERGDLVAHLPFEDARPFLVEGTTAEEWVTADYEALRVEAVSYLSFAVGKVLEHRGLSAARSVSHYRAWLWLLNLLPEDWDTAPYAQYGAPKLVLAAAALNTQLPFHGSEENRDMFMRMAEGVECRPNCTEGCDR